MTSFKTEKKSATVQLTVKNGRRILISSNYFTWEAVVLPVFKRCSGGLILAPRGRDVLDIVGRRKDV